MDALVERSVGEQMDRQLDMSVGGWMDRWAGKGGLDA